jgi:acetaldehyde dehydrogenase
MDKDQRTAVAIIGSGSIGVDLLYKVMASKHLELAFIVGRSKSSVGLKIAKDKGIEASADGMAYLQENQQHYDIVFDATSASSHVANNEFFKKSGKFAIDLTPAKLGVLCVPSINLHEINNEQNVNLITCGGQASLPLAHALKNSTDEIEYLEVVSTISSASAGMATRENINEYLVSTEYAIRKFSGAKTSKAILNINPAKPGVCMQTTIYAYAKFRDFELVKSSIRKMEQEVQKYVPGYKVILEPILDAGRITIILTVHGSGDYLPKFTGNLDIINCAAIAVAEQKHLSLH